MVRGSTDIRDHSRTGPKSSLIAGTVRKYGIGRTLDEAIKAREGPASCRMMRMPTYRAVTRQIEVTVEPNSMPDRSSPDEQSFFWSYTIVITNSGAETVQLRTRHWIITDASGRTAGCARRGRGRRAAGARAGRAFRIHQRRSAADRVRCS